MVGLKPSLQILKGKGVTKSGVTYIMTRFILALKTWAHLAFPLLPLDHQIQFNKISQIGPRSYHGWVELGSRLLGLGPWHKVVEVSISTKHTHTHTHTQHKPNKGLAIYIKKYLMTKEELWKLKYFHHGKI
jgi:hypothetical protein